MPDDTRVLYNETCPVCRFEIDAYARRAKTDGLPIRFDGLVHAEAWGLTPDQAARRLHVLHRGQLLSGIPAFQALWRQLPHMRWLARLTSLPVIHQIACVTYDRLLAPVIYRAHLRRQRISR